MNMQDKTRRTFVFTAWIGMIAVFVAVVLSYARALSTEDVRDRNWFSFTLHDLVFIPFVPKKSLHADTTLALQSGQSIFVDVEGIDVKIMSGPSGQVKVDWSLKGREKTLRDYRYHVSRDGDIVKITGEKDGAEWSKWGSFSGTVRITIPDTIDVTVNAIGGDIRLQKITGTIRLQSIGGDIEGSDISGSLKAETSGGDISLRRADVSILEMLTSGGDISASAISNSPSITARSIGGDIKLYLPDDVKADIDASTSGGDIRCYYKDEIEGTVEESFIKGTLNGGGNSINLRTSGGDILIASK